MLDQIISVRTAIDALLVLAVMFAIVRTAYGLRLTAYGVPALTACSMQHQGSTGGQYGGWMEGGGRMNNDRNLPNCYENHQNRHSNGKK